MDIKEYIEDKIKMLKEYDIYLDGGQRSYIRRLELKEDVDMYVNYLIQEKLKESL